MLLRTRRPAGLPWPFQLLTADFLLGDPGLAALPRARGRCSASMASSLGRDPPGGGGQGSAADEWLSLLAALSPAEEPCVSDSEPPPLAVVEAAAVGDDVLSRFGAALDEAARQSQTLALDPDHLRVVRHCVQPQQRWAASLSASANLLRIARSTLDRWTLRSSAASWVLARFRWRQAEAALAAAARGAGGVQPVVLVEASMYDGVDFKVRAGRERGARSLVATRTPGRRVWRSSCTQRLSRLAVCLVDGEPLFLGAEQPCVLQPLQRNTAPCIAAALKAQLLPVGPFGGHVPRRVRVVASDSSKANLRAERLLLVDRNAEGRGQDGPRWETLSLPCAVHTMAAIQEKTFRLTSQHITGVLQALCSDSSGSAGLYRQAWREVLSERLVLVDRPPGLAARRYKDWMLSVFSSEGAVVAPWALRRYAQGDWRKEGIFEYVAAPGQSRDEIVSLLQEFFVPAIASCTPRPWPRHRWVGFDVCLSDVGLLQAMHGLFRIVFERLLRMLERPGASSGVGAPDGVLEHGDDAGVPQGQGAGTANALGADFAAQNRAGRAQSRAFLATEELLSELVVMRLALEPIRAMMRGEMQLSSGGAPRPPPMDATPVAHLGHGAEAVVDDVATLPAVLAATGAAYRRFQADLRTAEDRGRGAPVPQEALTVSRRHLLFRLLSRQGALAHATIAAERDRYPMRLFLLFFDEDAAAELAGACSECLDDYSRGFREHYAGRLTSVAAQSELLSVTMVTRTSTTPIERGHAGIRRQLLERSQTNAAAAPGVSGSTLLRKLWQRRLELRGGAPALPGSRSGARRRGKRRGGGGAWRVFCSQNKSRSDHGRRDWRRLAEEYRLLPDHERRRLRAQGQLATTVHRAGGRACGRPLESQRRVERRRLLDQLARGLQQGGEELASGARGGGGRGFGCSKRPPGGCPWPGLEV